MRHPTSPTVRDTEWIKDMFDPGLTPVYSDELQYVLDSPVQLCELLSGHVESAGHAPASTVDVITATFRELFTWAGGNSVLEISPAGWNDFITSGTDPYERALCCQTLYQLLDLAGMPSPHDAPLPNPRVVPQDLLPLSSTIATRKGRTPTRRLSSLELAVVRYAVLPQLKGTTVHKGRHRPPRRDQFVTAVTVGATGLLLSDAQLAALHVTHIEVADHRLMFVDNGSGVFPASVMLDDWTSARLNELLAHDLTLAATDDTREAHHPGRTPSDRFAQPLLYGGRHAPTSRSATSTMNAKVTAVLNRTGLTRVGLTTLSVRLAGAHDALANGATASSVAAQLGFVSRRGQPDVEHLTSFLDQ